MNFNNFVNVNPNQKLNRQAVMGPPDMPLKKKTASSVSSCRKWGKSQYSVLNLSTIQSNSTFTNNGDTRIVLALTEGRGEARCEMGMACIDLSHPTLTLCQIADLETYINTLTKINILNPSEIVVPQTFLETPSNILLVDKLKEQFPQRKIIGAPRKTFNKSNGMDRILQLGLGQTSCVELEHKYYALAAAAGLISYLQNSLYVFYANRSLNIKYEESEGHALIDVSTADRLELVLSTKPMQASKYCSLFSVLNNCYTKSGMRLLRSSILQPPYKLSIIEENQNCVTALIKRPQKLLQIQATIQKLENIDQLLMITNVIFGNDHSDSCKQLNYLLMLKGFVELIEPMGEILEDIDNEFFKDLSQTIKSSNNFDRIKNEILNVLHPNAHLARTGDNGVRERCFAIKSGINGLLDTIRHSYSERLQEMRNYVKGLEEKYNRPLMLSYNVTKSYHIVLKLTKQQRKTMKASDLPSEFIQIQRLSASFTMKTLELVNLTTSVDDFLQEILKISNLIVNKTITQLKADHIQFFYKLCQSIGKLDMYQSLAEVSIRGNFVRPKFATFTEIVNSRHPILEHLLDEKLIPNSIRISPEYNLQIITGPNGSGKSIYIRQIMLLQVMAQIGCYLPAEVAWIRPQQRMFARIYLEDKLEYGASAFMMEINEIKYMMMLRKQDSLFIIDELCRSTSVDEGTALAMAILEKFAMAKTVFTIVTTHYTKLCNLSKFYPNITLHQMETLSNGDEPMKLKLDFQFAVKDGVTALRHYGIYIVRNIWPIVLIQQALRFLNLIKRKENNDNFGAGCEIISDEFRFKYQFESDLKKMKSMKKLTVANLNKYFNKYCEDLMKFNVNVTEEEKKSWIEEAMKRKQSEIPAETNANNESNNVEKSLNSSSYNQVEEFLEQSVGNLEKMIPEIEIAECTNEINVDGEEEDEFVFTQAQGETTSESNVQTMHLFPKVHIIEGPNNYSQSTTNSQQTLNFPTTSSSSFNLGKGQPTRKRFIFPKKLTKKQIQDEFSKQDEKFYQNEDVNRSLTRLLNRPSVKQMQNAKRLAVGRRTEDGMEFIDVQENENKRRRRMDRSVMLSETSFSCNNLVNVKMFSDENAECFKRFVEDCQGEPDMNMFQFQFNLSNEGNNNESEGGFGHFQGFSDNPNNSLLMNSFRRRTTSELNATRKSFNTSFTFDI